MSGAMLMPDCLYFTYTVLVHAIPMVECCWLDFELLFGVLCKSKFYRKVAILHSFLFNTSHPK